MADDNTVTVTNERDRSFPVRFDDGVKRIAPGGTATGEMQPSLRSYYENVRGVTVDGGTAKADGGGSKTLDTMTTAELTEVADAEGIDLGTATTNGARVAIINAFRPLFADNNVEGLRAIAEREDVDLGDRTRKADIVNAIVAKRGVVAA